METLVFGCFQELYQQLRNVDPLAGSVTILAQGKQARAEQMCKYFQDHVQVAGPVQKTVSLVEVSRVPRKP